MSVRSVSGTQRTEIAGLLEAGSARPVRWARSSALATDSVLDIVESAAEQLPPIALASSPAPQVISPAQLRRRQILADISAVVAGLVAAVALDQPGAADRGLDSTIAFFVVSGLAWMMCIGMNRLYLARAVARRGEELQRITASGLAASGLTLMLGSLAGVDHHSSWIVTSFCTVMFFVVTERVFARRAFNRLRSSGRLRRRVAIIGTDQSAQDLFDSIRQQPNLGYDVVGYISVGGRIPSANGRVIGHVDDTEAILRETGCIGAMVSLNSVNAVEVNRLARQLTDSGFHIALTTSLRDFDVSRLRPQAIGEQNLVYLEPTIREGWRSHAKRVFDLALASIGLLVGAPIIAIAAIAIRLDSPGPIFFRQVRVGRDGVQFEMIKLRTMYTNAEALRAELEQLNESDGPLFKIADDPRVTRVGRFLRRTSIDELPQFWNVLRGDMSAVGPRPALPKEVADWDDQLRERLRVLPGLTGVWQVSGRSSTSFAEYKRLDLYYVDNWSLLHDVKIVLKTFAVVALQRGAS